MLGRNQTIAQLCAYYVSSRMLGKGASIRKGVTCTSSEVFSWRGGLLGVLCLDSTTVSTNSE